MIGKMSINNTKRVSLKNATTITHNSNILFEIGTSHIYPTDNNECSLEDMKDGVDDRTYNGTNETVNEDVKDGVESRA